MGMLTEHAEDFWKVSLGVGAVAFVIVLCIIASYFLHNALGDIEWRVFVATRFSIIYGIPAAAVAAFGIIVFFGITPTGDLRIKFPGFEVSGPAGSSLMYVVVFLAFIFALKLLQPKPDFVE